MAEINTITGNTVKGYRAAVRRDILACLALALITCAVYWQVRDHEFVLLDDNMYIFANRHVLNGPTPDSIRWAFSFNETSYWHPLTWLSLMLDARLFGGKSAGFHLENVALHILSTLLLFYILRRMTHSFWPGFFVAALFALHPVNVESVAWATERKNTLSTFFWMLTVAAYLRYTARPGILRYLPVLLFLALGLMTKSFLASLPFVLLLLDFWPLGRLGIGQAVPDSVKGEKRGVEGNPWHTAGRLVLEKTPLFMLSAAAVILSSLSASSFRTSTEVIPFTHRVAVSFISYILYIVKMVWPARLAVYRPYPESVPLWQSAGALLILLGLTFMILKAARRAPYLTVGWLWYLGTLFPVIGLVQAGLWPFVADRFAYVPFIGLYIMAAWGVPELLKQWRFRNSVLTVISVILLTAYAAVTWINIGYWQNSEKLFRHALAITPGNYLIHNSMGALYASQGKFDDALVHINEALRLEPGRPRSISLLAYVLACQGKKEEALAYARESARLMPDNAAIRYNLGYVYSLMGRYDNAIDEYTAALKTEPDYAEAHMELARIYISRGDLGQSLVHAREASRLMPDNADAHTVLAQVLLSMGNVDEACVHARIAVRLKPDSADARITLIKILERQGRLDETIGNTQELLQQKPDNAEARTILARTLMRQGKLTEALSNAEEAVRLNPGSGETHSTLAGVLALMDRLDEAIEQYRESVRLNPGDSNVHYNYANLLVRKGQLDDAVIYYKEALKLQPDYAQAHNNLGNVYTFQKKYAQATEQYREALRYKPDFTDALKNLEKVSAIERKK
ncbi:tetratricopeptide repeat protein [bacterium]|nr:tetratricopeptide repeat protein [bacterium]